MCIAVASHHPLPKASKSRGIECIQWHRTRGRTASGTTHTLRRLRIIQEPRPILVNVHGHMLPRKVVRREREVVHAVFIDMRVESCIARCRVFVSAQVIPVVEAVIRDKGRGRGEVERHAACAGGYGCLGCYVERLRRMREHVRASGKVLMRVRG